MRVLVTGASGFVGRQLVRRLLADDPGSQAPITQLVLVDQQIATSSTDRRVTQLVGSLADSTLLQQALGASAEIVFHLASVPGGLAEQDYDLGRHVNLDATLGLLEALRQQDRPPRFVFASSVAVYGEPMPAMINDMTQPRPTLSYGTHKLIGELLVSDFSRRGWIDGISLRLPGIVARPPGPSGLLSAFMSDIFWKLAAGEPYVCPVSADAVAWWMSLPCCVDNLLHAAQLTPDQRRGASAFALPVLRLTIAELVDALAGIYGDDRRALVQYAPNEALEASFGCYPPLAATTAERLGFRSDRTVEALIHNAMAL